MATSTALTPVTFNGATLTVASINDILYVAFKTLCEAIGLDPDSQLQRLKRHPVLSATTVITTVVAQDGKTREVVCLPLDKLNGWLFGVTVSRARPEIRERLVQYQRECFDVLAGHFLPPSHAPYSVSPGQTLSAPQAQELRDLLTQGATQVVSERRAAYMTGGWSKLKAHFGVAYRQIPAHLFADAVSIITRHTADYTTKQLEVSMPQSAQRITTPPWLTIDWDYVTAAVERGEIPTPKLLDFAQAATTRLYMDACSAPNGFGSEVSKRITKDLPLSDLHAIASRSTLELLLRATATKNHIVKELSA